MPKIKYQITSNHFEEIEVKTDRQLEIVKDLNKEFYREEKINQKYQKKCVSMDWLFDEYDFEFAEERKTALDEMIEQEEKEAFKVNLHLAIKLLTEKQIFKRNRKGETSCVFWCN